MATGNSDFDLSKKQILDALKVVAETIRKQKPAAKLYFMVLSYVFMPSASDVFIIGKKCHCILGKRDEFFNNMWESF